jgi:hypothetical protein
LLLSLKVCRIEALDQLWGSAVSYNILAGLLALAIICWPTKEKESWNLPLFFLGGGAVLYYLFG